jgi:tight adherence protein C
MGNFTYQILIPILTFLSVMAIGASILITWREKRLRMEIRLQDNRLVGVPKEPHGTKFDLFKFIAKIGNLVSHGNTSKSLNEQLMRAGYINPVAPAIYTGVKVLLFMVGLVATILVSAPFDMTFSARITSAMLGAAAMFFLPNLAVSMKLKKCQREVRYHLPEAIDLLEICVTAGIGLDMAWNIVSVEMQNVSPILSNAMSLTNFEINLGANRVQAMRHMAERTGVDELASLAAILIQTERFGTSISDTLRSFAHSMREERSFTAEEKAEKMPVKLIIPMVLFIFPAVLIILGGPAMISIFTILLKE